MLAKKAYGIVKVIRIVHGVNHGLHSFFTFLSLTRPQGTRNRIKEVQWVSEEWAPMLSNDTSL